jgi:hypothetical protein
MRVMGFLTRCAVGAFLTVLGVAAASACSQTLSELAPFPCAQDNSCPAGLTCVAGVGCTTGVLYDQACGDGGSPCAEGKCVAGLCLPSCQTGPACDPGRVCSYPPLPPNQTPSVASCILDCSATPCPSGLSCQQLDGTKKGCVSSPALASLDQPCATPQDCQVLYGATPLPFTCSRGVCAPFCVSPGDSCADPKRTCNAVLPVEYSGCLVDCTMGQPCPAGLTCASSLAGVNIRVCVNATISP